jgi:hypothetical protein
VRNPARTACRIAAGAAQAPSLLSGIYSATLLAAAARPASARPPAPGAGPTALTVLVPAHDEEATLPGTLEALVRAPHPGDLDVVVIADNCTDGTAAVARSAGVRVLERTAPDARGKGQALAWALGELGPEVRDAVVVVDADCRVSPGFFAALDEGLRAGADAVQADYRVANPEDSPAAALRAIGFLLHNTVRPAGRERLGLSSGILGTGMALRRETLEAVPWAAFSVSEDREYHYALVASGRRVAFAPAGAVHSDMPARADVARGQELRWEGEKARLARTWVPRLVADGVRRRDPVRLEAGLEGLMLPQAAATLLGAGGMLLGLAGRSRALAASGALALALQAGYVLGGLAVVGAPASSYRALLAVPGLLVRRAGTFARLLGGRGPSEWVRTARG